MVCIYCGKETIVFNSRHLKRPNQTWRRRKCLSCKAVFTTNELIDLEKSLVIKDGSAYKPFLRDKLFVSLYDSLKHRKTALKDATALTDTVIGRLNKRSPSTLDKNQVITTVKEILKRFDKAAHTYYTAYHKLK